MTNPLTPEELEALSEEMQYLYVVERTALDDAVADGPLGEDDMLDSLHDCRDVLHLYKLLTQRTLALGGAENKFKSYRFATERAIAFLEGINPTCRPDRNPEQDDEHHKVTFWLKAALEEPLVPITGGGTFKNRIITPGKQTRQALKEGKSDGN